MTQRAGLIAVWLAVAIVGGAAGRVQAQVARPSVLVLFVDDSSQPFIRDMSGGLATTVLRHGPASPLLYYEYLDTVRFDDPAYRARLRASFKEKYARRRLDLVVAVATSAVDFAAEAREELWPDGPVLFASYFAPVPDRVLEHSRSYGLSFDRGLEQSLTVMKTVFPDTQQVAVVGGGSEVERERQARTVENLRHVGLKAVDVNVESLSETTSALAALPDHTVVFIEGGQLAADGTVTSAWTLCEMISSAASRPTFMVGASLLGCGVVGGLMRDFTKIGTRIGDRAMEVLSRTAPPHEQVPFDAVSTLVFDARQLARWQVDERRLPPGSRVQFRPFSVWREYRGTILGAAAILFVQFALIVGLLYERRHRIKAEADSRRHLALAAHIDRREAVNALTGSIAHELAQPLGSIRVNADAADRLIAANRASPDELREILHDIRRDDERATEIVQRHRAMLKQRDLERRPVDIYGVVRESVALVSHDAQSRRVSIDATLPATACPVLGDEVLLQQVVVNLLMNAMDAMSHEAPSRRRVTVGTAITTGGVQLSVRDSGPGLAAEIDGRVFEPFVTTKPNGLGIGLSIVRSIVEAHGGTIEAHNVADGGAVFRLTLPCAAS